ncbi:MAG: hypothetical protein B6I24_09520 [Bacteroidetes bacterium 4572_128]|nr:MAG: hypothetical protein B6I24_09520 [Bacteroidetes bacterium 4572_128]
MVSRNKIFKYLFLTFISFFALFLTTKQSVYSCEIEFEILGKKKETYKSGDIIVVKVKVIYTHRVCTETIKSTKFNTNGGKILKATKWKETSTNVWERKLKLEVIGNKDGKLNLVAVRTCDKTGGFGSIDIDIEKIE